MIGFKLYNLHPLVREQWEAMSISRVLRSSSDRALVRPFAGRPACKNSEFCDFPLPSAKWLSGIVIRKKEENHLGGSQDVVRPLRRHFPCGQGIPWHC